MFVYVVLRPKSLMGVLEDILKIDKGCNIFL
jgi:hypothetical protein